MVNIYYTIIGGDTMKPIKVLSIDWDYFVDVTAEQRVLIFPDGHEHFGVNIYNTVWMNKYAECAELEDLIKSA